MVWRVTGWSTGTRAAAQWARHARSPCVRGRRQIPCHKVFETEHCLAFLDAFPCAKARGAPAGPRPPRIAAAGPEWAPMPAAPPACACLLQGHALLVPKAGGFRTVMEMPQAVAEAVLGQLPRLASMVQAASGADGVNVLQNNGSAAGPCEASPGRPAPSRAARRARHPRLSQTTPHPPARGCARCVRRCRLP